MEKITKEELLERKALQRKRVTGLLVILNAILLLILVIEIVYLFLGRTH